MREILKPAERLAVGLDFPGGHNNVRWEVGQAMRAFAGLGVALKIGWSAILSCGHDVIYRLQEKGFRVFVDAKFYDTPDTLEAYGRILGRFKPFMVTVSCAAGIQGMRALKNALPKETIVLGITVPTSFEEEDASAVHGSTVEAAVLRLAGCGAKAGIDGLVCAGTDVSMLREGFGGRFLLVTPNIRPKGTAIPGDRQNWRRSVTPTEAIRAGSDMIVVGRPITLSANPRDATLRIIEEIARAA